MAELHVNVTPRAAQQIKAQLARRTQTKPQSGVRLGVKGGGCSGMSYVIEYCDQPRSKRSEEHTSELQSRFDLVCRLLLEKKKKKKNQHICVLLDAYINEVRVHADNKISTEEADNLIYAAKESAISIGCSYTAGGPARNLQ